MSNIQRSNGRPEPEVIVNFADGFAYSKGKMEEAIRTGFLEKPAPKTAKESATSVKREHVDLLIEELEIPRAQAEKLIIQHNLDITKAIEAWITP
ncbi:hypothetical protein POSPLADRAFT_1054257 [Postia placenta MAD-698-R-SB12]|uniref:Nascent polypeptide-associated complex subunit alpha-like UBA domain-containing protein n=1 Tax=Postia placenta MAD-698-R-SB12 TaxID=670580 RepID=A0A1X6NA40_9APHY|nr:hypothetical protein POSPLADRAFT_1054257 [Postia placenta MAD-698-R-SB12]OSX65518.1 hypothetical protein POSPLADRAFT_1054257 [Postia placenta MAD-698-R-SB12]